MSSQLYDLSTNEMLKPMFPNLRILTMFVQYVTSHWDSISGEAFKNDNSETDYLKSLS